MIRGIWDRETVALLLLAAIMPMALTFLWFGGSGAIGRLALALIVAGLWHLIFMLARAQPPSFAGAIAALAVAMLVPEELGMLQLALGISFGSVMAELVFGGWGRNVVNPATVTLAFLGFSFPAAPWPELVLPIAWAAIPAALIGVGFGVMSGRIVGGAVLAGVFALAFGVEPGPVLPAAGVVLVLLVCDPVASAATGGGRWLNGLLYGGLVVLFMLAWKTAAPVQIAVSAALFSSLAAPLLDEAAIGLWLARRRRRHG
ncbi:Na(+)-translocating NADH-quinone reductase subunit B [Nitratireductor indicus C115]|uniref:Na(+)-translocating NADH-quinone reductase subunit B n=1 Tax=Nitratireductor indicus C115 TaxID=1231190 RepID=K2PLD3_9HYPH|nr:RnfABCDGE type electron transport complex subunit D [Nitratireductor indicus]EKF41942.1 Na(+)-translocating NADH-quinone reductase subunit B [Nitratireductor indicus C115]SFQ47946.1 Na+-transporting NADH:ubiquinone oxidoreductase subunit B [Nitratireductor indicus]